MRILAAATLFSAALAGSAHGAATEEEARAACTGDAFSFCASSIPDREKVAQCLRTNRARISADCRIVLDGGKPSKKS